MLNPISVSIPERENNLWRNFWVELHVKTTHRGWTRWRQPVKDIEPCKEQRSRNPMTATAWDGGACAVEVVAITGVTQVRQEKKFLHPPISYWCFHLAQPNWKPEVHRISSSHLLGDGVCKGIKECREWKLRVRSAK